MPAVLPAGPAHELIDQKDRPINEDRTQMKPGNSGKTLPTLISVTLALALVASAVQAEPRAIETTVIGPFTGAQAPLHPDNVTPHKIAYMGTDLGWTYEHNG